MARSGSARPAASCGAAPTANGANGPAFPACRPTKSRGLELQERLVTVARSRRRVRRLAKRAVADCLRSVAKTHRRAAGRNLPDDLARPDRHRHAGRAAIWHGRRVPRASRCRRSRRGRTSAPCCRTATTFGPRSTATASGPGVADSGQRCRRSAHRAREITALAAGSTREPSGSERGAAACMPSHGKIWQPLSYAGRAVQPQRGSRHGSITARCSSALWKTGWPSKRQMVGSHVPAPTLSSNAPRQMVVFHRALYVRNGDGRVDRFDGDALDAECLSRSCRAARCPRWRPTAPGCTWPNGAAGASGTAHSGRTDLTLPALAGLAHHGALPGGQHALGRDAGARPGRS